MSNGVNLKSLLESILFLRGEATDAAHLAKLAGAKKSAVEVALRELQAEHRERGIVLVENG